MSTALLAPDAVPHYDAAPLPAAARAKPAKRKAGAKAKPPAAAAAKANAATVKWCKFGVAFTLALSAMLNGYANSLHASVPLAGWLMGFSIPVLVLTLAKVASEKYRDEQRLISYFAGGSGVALLLLSVWHCSQSIALLTGSGLLLAIPLAVAIDAGLVSLEVALVAEPRE